MTRQEIVALHGPTFQRVFKTPLRRFVGAYGFDMQQFDQWLNAPLHMTIAEAVQAAYGDDAADLITTLKNELWEKPSD